ncbi:MAG TPA: hypothetical protein VMV86_04495 [Methanosarcinales archaeon]|nr:hypothetical protein [Methanosarcinales archaeon]
MKDKCVMCGAETPFDIQEHIDYRLYYIEGAGQLCEECFDNDLNGKEVIKCLDIDHL